MSNCMGGRKTKKMSGGGSAGAAAQQKVEKDLKTREKIRKDIREELDAVPFKDKVKKVINKVTGNAKGGKIKGYAGGGFPDLNKDGKVTKKDILMGRGVKMAKGGMALPKNLGEVLGKNQKKFDGRVVKPKKVDRKKYAEDVLNQMKKMPKMAEGGLTGETLNKAIKQAMEYRARNKKKFDGKVVNKMAKGGSVKGRRGDGICSRGRTKGRII